MFRTLFADDAEKAPQHRRGEKRDQGAGARPFERFLLRGRERGGGGRRKRGIGKEGGPYGGEQGRQQGCGVEVCGEKVMEIPNPGFRTVSIIVFVFDQVITR